jgi:hypothetical protein
MKTQLLLLGICKFCYPASPEAEYFLNRNGRKGFAKAHKRDWQFFTIEDSENTESHLLFRILILCSVILLLQKLDIF